MLYPVGSCADPADVHTGQTGLGKSTLINTIFASHLIDSKGRLESDEPVRQTTEIHPVSHGTFVLIVTVIHIRVLIG